MKIIKGSIANGIFKFLIDGVDQNVGSDHLMSGIWMTVERSVQPGFHKFEWQYLKYNNIKNYSMEDLAAEIEYIIVKGVSYSPKTC